jgi:HEAT repeat protein
MRLWIPSLVLLTAAAVAQTEKDRAAEAALQEFHSYWKNRNPHVRQAAVQGLHGVDHHKVTSALLECLKDADPGVRRTAVAALSTQRNDLGVQELLRRAWMGRDKSERLAILQALRESRPPLARKVGLELGLSKEWEIRLAAVELLARYEDPDGSIAGLLKTLTGDREPLVRLAAMDAFCAQGGVPAITAAIAGTEDPDWRIQAASVAVLRKSRDRAAIQPLIDILRRKKGRILDDAHAALMDLTQTQWPLDGERWQEWWDQVKVGFQIPTAEEIAKRKEKAALERKGYDPPAGAGRGDYAPYHGIRTRSRLLLFIIDVSTSMTELVTFDEADTAAKRAFEERYGDLRVKIDIARETLISLVAELPDHVRFNIITFSSEVDLWQKFLVSADGGNKARAIKFLSRLTPQNLVASGARNQGTTNTCGAIEAAYGALLGTTLEKNTYKTEADTVFLLTDGLPTSGRITEPKLLLEAIEELTKRSRLVIHTIGFGNANKALLEGIAQITGGQYVKIGY